MKAKLVSINNPDGTTAYVSLMPITDAEFERLKPSGAAFDTDDLTKSLTVSHGYVTDSESTLRYQHLQQYEQMLEAAEKRIAELEAVCREVIAVLKIQVEDELVIMAIGKDRFVFDDFAMIGTPYYTALRRLLDTLPPAE